MSRAEEMMARFDAEAESGPWICEIHGEYGTQAKPAEGYSGCPDCEADSRKAEAEFNQLCRRFIWWRDSSGIPARYRSRTVETWNPQGQHATLRVLKRYAASMPDRIDAGDGVTLRAPPGTGKTHLQNALISRACLEGYRAVYVSWPDLMSRARESARKRDSSNPLDQIAGTPLLAVDELGLGQETKWEMTQLFELLDYRYAEQLATLVATNLTTEQLPDRIGDRLVDRLMEMNTELILTGGSYRTAAHDHPSDPAFPKPEPMTIRRCQAGAMLERVLRNPDLHGRDV